MALRPNCSIDARAAARTLCLGLPTNFTNHRHRIHGAFVAVRAQNVCQHLWAAVLNRITRGFYAKPFSPPE